MDPRSTDTPPLVRVSLPGRLRDERGFGLVELTVGMLVLTVAVMGVAGAMSFGVHASAQARQRSVASALAAEMIEQARGLPYESLALDVEPAHSLDPEHPDHWVTQESPPRYDVLQTGTVVESLIVGGSIRHAQGPVSRGTTELDVHQYVTWTDDPEIAGAANYKRLAVVVTWRNQMVGGQSPRVVVSTFLFPGSVALVAVAPQAAEEPAPTSAEPPVEVQSCEGDTVAPVGSLEITSGAGSEDRYSNSTTVQVRLQAQDDCPDLYADLSNDGSTFSPIASLTPGLPSTVAWAIPAGDGLKAVHARFRDGAGNTSEVSQASVILDQTPPSVPGGFQHVTCSMNGSDRTVVFTWNPSDDANPSGYRLYRSVSSRPWEVIATTSDLQGQDTTRKSIDSVRYFVRAYDKAGNESGDSDVVSYARNGC